VINVSSFPFKNGRKKERGKEVLQEISDVLYLMSIASEIDAKKLKSEVGRTEEQRLKPKSLTKMF